MIKTQELASFDMKYTTYTSQFGTVFMAGSKVGIHTLSFLDSPEDEAQALEALNREARSQNITYNIQKAAPSYTFNTKQTHLYGTPFQLKVWTFVQTIPLGTTTTYRDIAHDLGIPKSTRAVAKALAKNPVALFVPCHRVIAHSGDLCGYRWSMARKKNLSGKKIMPLLVEQILA